MAALLLVRRADGLRTSVPTTAHLYVVMLGCYVPRRSRYRRLWDHVWKRVLKMAIKAQNRNSSFVTCMLWMNGATCPSEAKSTPSYDMLVVHRCAEALRMLQTIPRTCQSHIQMLLAHTNSMSALVIHQAVNGFDSILMNITSKGCSLLTNWMHNGLFGADRFIRQQMHLTAGLRERISDALMSSAACRYCRLSWQVPEDAVAFFTRNLETIQTKLRNDLRKFLVFLVEEAMELNVCDECVVSGNGMSEDVDGNSTYRGVLLVIPKEQGGEDPQAYRFDAISLASSHSEQLVSRMPQYSSHPGIENTYRYIRKD